VLDDLHWADEASIELLAALLRRGPEAPVLLAFAFRGAQAPVRLSAALGSPAVGLISLEPLTEAEVNELLAGVEPRTAAAIYRHGGGNPFYLHQLRRAGEEGRLDAVLDEDGEALAVSGMPVPSAVAASLAEELASLPVEQLVLQRPSQGSRSSRISPRRSPSSVRRTASTLWTPCWRST
jgi:predicted ATPase